MIAVLYFSVLFMAAAWMADRPAATCTAHTGPVWKDGGEPCGCTLPVDHDGDHECDCGSWWADICRRDLANRPEGNDD